ncbi:hypothetical protein IFM89_033124 [Coptis chinensis]|uniref:BHLH domain-containing protein n=1 Tax=Coptis chinensis TaxID=261450 RepID=A0A835HH43_9MAGN|nr:hypothetical protein IFM89_033124 [Coptis chinensis]
MGTASLLKEALKCLCGENRWSYAIFWKIGCQNPSLLVWEDFHYEPTRNSASSSISGIDSTDLLLKEWEGLWSYRENHFPQVGCQAEDRVGSLLNRLMINNHVHVVGEGIVGRTAFTDVPLWILQQNIIRDQYPSEVLAEVHHQFSAGMQTIAAIPVLPHGVVQLGSTLTIMENMGFINDVKSLFAQLGSVHGALSSDYSTKLVPDTASPLFGVPISSELARNSCSQVAKFTPFISANCSQVMSSSQPSGSATQPSHSLVTQNPAYMQCNASAMGVSSSLSPLMSTPATNQYQVKPHPVIKPNIPLSGQLGTRTVGAQVILSSSDTRLDQRGSPYHSNSRSDDRLLQSGSSFNSLTFMDQQVASCIRLQEPVNGSPFASNNSNTSQLRPNGGGVPNFEKDSVMVSLLRENHPPNTRNDLRMLASNPYAVNCSSTRPARPIKISSSDNGLVHATQSGILSNNSYVLPGVPHRSPPSINDNLTERKLKDGKQAMDNDLFQRLNIPLDQSDNHIPRCSPTPDYLRGCSVSSTKHAKESSRSQSVSCEDAYIQLPSGEDLFDILGLDFKSKQLYGSWNDMLSHGEDDNRLNASKDASTCITQTEVGHDINDSIEGGIFNRTGTDHLLDAVVSKVCSGSKQNSDDDMSGWTTLTKMSSSSVLTDSLKSGRVSMPYQKQVKMFGRPTSLATSQLTGSSSLIAQCSQDNAGEGSQINSLFGSQISLLCEDGSTMKRENSTSTAHSKRPDETGKLNRKRLRPGENPRPRPKDRQMIQDRVKELREIVPNGAKCSIDALLERTIKHMLFLQSVTKHADKLKHTGESKIISKDGEMLLEDNFDGGATWAFEVGSQSMGCPIIVEDLNTPRQMLVEMLCEEQGFFLEIADIIRGLGLTILKGVMEARNEKVWVRFTVEANRDVTRMEIFLSLVHLLEQAMKCNSEASKGPDTNNMMAHNTYHPASVPVTGRSVSLQ